MDKKAEFENALKNVMAACAVIGWQVEQGMITIEQAGVKLRSKSIELGVVACMPFRDSELNIHPTSDR